MINQKVPQDFFIFLFFRWPMGGIENQIVSLLFDNSKEATPRKKNKIRLERL
jgi:hypothetical protein